MEMPTSQLASTPPQAWHDEADLLTPDFWNPATDRWRIAMQSWVLQVDGLTIVVDTGVGNGRERPQLPPLHHLDTDFLHGMQAAGIDPEHVDIVINTHLHSDHVGWNTRRLDDAWAPTFPNARYLMPRADYEYFAPDSPTATDEMRIVFSDSIIPVTDQVELYDGEHRPANRCGSAPRPDTPPGPRWCGWTPAGPRCSSATSPTARSRSPVRTIRVGSMSTPPRRRSPASGSSPRPRGAGRR